MLRKSAAAPPTDADGRNGHRPAAEPLFALFAAWRADFVVSETVRLKRTKTSHPSREGRKGESLLSENQVAREIIVNQGSQRRPRSQDRDEHRFRIEPHRPKAHDLQRLFIPFSNSAPSSLSWRPSRLGARCLSPLQAHRPRDRKTVAPSQEGRKGSVGREPCSGVFFGVGLESAQVGDAAATHLVGVDRADGFSDTEMPG